MKISAFSPTVFVLLSMLSACQTHKAESTRTSILTETQAVEQTLIDIRRDIHQHPELAGKEFRTAGIVAEYLTELGLEVQPGIAGNSVIGILRGTRPGKSVGWRADMDAIPSDFEDNVSFRSDSAGVQHGCGHDVHIAIGLGIATVLAKHRDEVAGTVSFIFQAEEETFLGAKNLVATEAYRDLQLDEIFALHVTALPVGQLMVRPNELYAYQKIFRIDFTEALSAEESGNLHALLREKMLRHQADAQPWQVSNAFDPTLGLHLPSTIFDNYCFIDQQFHIDTTAGNYGLIMSAYETDQPNVAQILPRLHEILQTTEQADLVQSIKYIQENPTVLNHPELTNAAVGILQEQYGQEAVVMSHGQIPYFNDDFIYFQQQTPGVYFLLGGSNAEKGIVAMNHAPNFQVDEASISKGVSLFSSLLLERTNVEQ